jgi:hypothetical protein
MKRTPRKRAAHLGVLEVDGARLVVTYRSGWVHFRKRWSRGRLESLQLADVYRMAQVQKLFAFTPK